MPRYLTRHNDEFVLTEGSIDPTLSSYAKFVFPDYPQKHSLLSAVIGVDQFLWAYEAAKGFRFFEMIKPIEWTVEIAQERLIGYVDDSKWDAFLRGESKILHDCFTKTRPPTRDFSVLLPFPLYPCEIVSRRVYKIANPHQASVVEEKKCALSRFRPPAN
jgi:hypothetical protein